MNAESKQNNLTPFMMLGLLLAGSLLIILVFVSRSNSEDSASPGFAAPGQSSQETPVPANQTAVPTQYVASHPSPKTFEQLIGAPTQLAVGAPAIAGPVTEASLRNYIAANPSAGGIVARNFQITSIQFETIAQLKSLLAEHDPFWDSFPADMQVAYVTLSGDFVAETDPAPADPAKATTTYHSAYRVFSVVLGNELGGGVGPK